METRKPTMCLGLVIIANLCFANCVFGKVTSIYRTKNVSKITATKLRETKEIKKEKSVNYTGRKEEKRSKGAANYNRVYKNYVALGYGYSLSAANVQSAVFSDSDKPETYIIFVSYKNIPLTNLKGLYKISAGRSFKYMRGELEFVYSPKVNVQDEAVFLDDPSTGYHAWSYDISSRALLAHIYHDFKLKGDNNRIQFYAGLGAGVSQNRTSQEVCKFIFTPDVSPEVFSYPEVTKNSFAWDAALGIQINLNERTYVDIGYKYIDFGKVASSTYLVPVDKKVAAYYTLSNVKGRITRNSIFVGLGMRF